MDVFIFGLDCLSILCLAYVHVPHVNRLILSLNSYFVIWGLNVQGWFIPILNIQLVLEQVHLLWFKYLSVISDPLLRWMTQSLNVPLFFLW